MKNQTPIKRHPAVISFSRDHHFGLLLGWKIRQGLNKAVDPERISNYVLYFFDKELEKHFSEEETLLFSQLPAANELRQRAEKDHAGLRQLIGAIRENKQNKTALLQLADDLDKHIRFEERELFGYLQNNLTEKALEAAGSRSANNSQAIDDQWQDVFWDTKQRSGL